MKIRLLFVVVLLLSVGAAHAQTETPEPSTGNLIEQALTATAQAPPALVTRVILRSTEGVDPADTAAIEAVFVERFAAAGVSGGEVRAEFSPDGFFVTLSLPPVDDVSALLDFLTTPARLEFIDLRSLVSDPQALTGQVIPTEGTAPDADFRYPAVVVGDDIIDAIALPDEFSGGGVIEFTLSEEGGQRFEKWTSANIGQPLAITLDGVVLSAPLVQAPLSTNGIITGSFTLEEAETLAAQLRTGELPVPFEVLSLDFIGAPVSGATRLVFGADGVFSFADPAFFSDVMTARLDEFGLTGTSVVANNDSSGFSVEVTLPPGADADAVGALLSERAMVEIIDFTDEMVDVFSLRSQVIETEFSTPGADELDLPPTIITNADIIDAVAEVEEPFGPVVRITFSDDAVVRLAAVEDTLRLGVTTDGLVRNVFLDQDLSGALIAGGLTEADTERLAAQLRAGAPLTFPLVYYGVEPVE